MTIASKKRIFYCIIITILIILWLLPLYTDGIFEVMLKNGSIDGSLKIGLNWADKIGLRFGEDIVFTYGPLYFLANNFVLSFNKSIIILANVFNIILWFSALFLLTYNIAVRINFSDSKSKIVSHIAILAFIVAIINVFIGISEVLLLVSFLILFNILEKNVYKKINILWLSSVGFFLAIISLIKFVYFIDAIALIIIAFVIFIVARKYLNLLPLVISYLFFFVLFWILLEKSFSPLFLFLKNSLLISFGYSENVQLFAEGWEAKFGLFYVILIFLLWFGILLFGIIKKNKSVIYYFSLSFPVIFLIYKQGFMRHDYFHSQEYFRFMIYLLIFTMLIFGNKLWRLFPVFIILFIFALPFKSAYDTLSIREQIAKNSRELKAAAEIFLPWKNDEYKIKLEEDIKEVKEDYPIGENIISKIDKDETVDIFTWEIFMLYIYDLKWTPRPIIQSYNAYSPSLDTLNANHFNVESAPKKVIYKIAGVEDRYPIFDEPAVFQKLLKNYDFIDYDYFGYGLLERKREFEYYEKIEISKDIGTFKELIKVPEINDGYLFCNMDIKLNSYGKLKNLLYKGDYIFIKFYFKDKQREPVIKRFVRANGVNGFYLTGYIEDIEDLNNAFKLQYDYTNPTGTIDFIEIISVDDSSYISDFNMEFYKLAFPEN